MHVHSLNGVHRLLLQGEQQSHPHRWHRQAVLSPLSLLLAPAAAVPYCMLIQNCPIYFALPSVPSSLHTSCASVTQPFSSGFSHSHSGTEKECAHGAASPPLTRIRNASQNSLVNVIAFQDVTLEQKGYGTGSDLNE